MADFVTLLCPTCGAKLQVSSNTTTLSCAYCGNKHTVSRQNGTIHLEAMMLGMQTSMDKTAAELAIPRLTTEIAQLEDEKTNMEARELSEWAPRKSSVWVTIAVVVGMIGIFVGMSMGEFLLMAISLVIFLASCWAYSKRAYNAKLARANKQAAILSLQEILTAKQKTLNKNRTIVNS